MFSSLEATHDYRIVLLVFGDTSVLPTRHTVAHWINTPSFPTSRRSCDSYRPQLCKLLLFVALDCQCLVRLTSVIAWMLLSRPFCGNLPRTMSFHACCLPFALDSAYNGITTLVLPAFLRVNASSIHLFHGSTPWHYYLTQPFSLLEGPTLPSTYTAPTLL